MEGRSENAGTSGSGDSIDRMLCIFGGPYVRQGPHRVAIPEGAQRLLVFVALHRGRVDRRQVAGSLWPEGGDERAAGNLRSALWRLKGTGADLILADKGGLCLQPSTRVDVDAMNDWAARMISGTAARSDLSLAWLDQDSADLLPGWYDDWVIFERERLRQRLLHAFEALSTRLSAASRFAEAVEAAMVAVRLEPLRESAQRVLIQAHLAEGNLIEASRVLDRYSAQVREDLGVAPSPNITALIDDRLDRRAHNGLPRVFTSARSG